MKKIGILLMVFVLISLFSISKVFSAKKKIDKKPNILLIITDQQTSSAMSCTGNSYLHTPAMDKLAESGIRFDKCYVTQPLCLPFRSSLQTGRYPHEIGTINNGLKINNDFPMLGNLVATSGYKVDYFGKWHIGTSPEKAGYKDYDNVGKDPKKTERATEYLLQKHKKPFFLTVSLMNPHNVCQLARANADGSILPDGAIEAAPTNLKELPPLPDNFDFPENEPTVLREIQKSSKKHYPTAAWDELTWRQYLWGYYRLVEKVDAQIGQILEALEKGGYAQNTVVIFTSDHGEGVAMHHWNQKQILYDQATKVPLIINWNGITQKSVYPELVSNALDIPVTIFDIIGIEKPVSLHGHSLLPIMKGTLLKPRDFVVSETMFAEGGEPLGAKGRMLRTKKYKYCIYDNGEKREQLFDMEKDPGEMKNLAFDKNYRKELNRHRETIIKWAKDTNDNEFPYEHPK